MQTRTNALQMAVASLGGREGDAESVLITACRFAIFIDPDTVTVSGS